MYENAPEDEYIFTIEACEREDDECTDTLVNYYLYDQDDFRIDQESGEIHTAIPVTHPIDYHYRFFVVVTAGGLTQFHDVTVFVSHYNNYDPYFYSKVYDVGVFRVAVPGTYIKTLLAEDDDREAYNRELSYYITGGSQMHSFDLNATTGRLTLAARLPTTSDVYELTVTVRDSGAPQRESSATVNVHLVDMSGECTATLCN